MTGSARIRAQGNRCIFCDNVADSREHVFGEWLRKWVDTDLTGNHRQTLTSFDSTGGLLDVGAPVHITHSGGSMTRRLPIVCAERCNSGWMSRLEASIEPWFGLMVQGASISLDLNQRRQLALWAEKTVMVFETTDEATATATPDQREYIREHQTPNPGTDVWLGRCGTSEWLSRVLHFDGSSADQAVRGRWDLIGIGEVMLLVAGTNHPMFTVVTSEVAEAAADLSQYMRHIWPGGNTSATGLPQPDLLPISTGQAMNISALPGVQSMLLAQQDQNGGHLPDGA